MKLAFVLNGRPVVVQTAPDRRAVDLLRELGALGPDSTDSTDSPDTKDATHATGAKSRSCISDMKDVKEGCGTGECGACSVLVDGVHKLSCLMLAAQLEGRELTTPRGLGTPEAPHAIQRAFAERGAVQCGFCSPGMTIAAAALLAENLAPTRQDIRRAISGNLCRCTGYVMIVDAVEAAARELRCDTAAGNEPGSTSDPASGSASGPTPGDAAGDAADQSAGTNAGTIAGKQPDRKARQKLGCAPGRKAGKP
ncbi:(2Fe-2S)-binding protein [Humidesulfovibrio sp.]